MMNRIHNIGNQWQGQYKRVLCVCSAGLLRSPTAAVVLSQDPFNFNTRAAGIEDSYALVPVDDVLLLWADEIVCMTQQHEAMLRYKIDRMPKTVRDQVTDRIITLEIPDNFAYRDPQLMEMIAFNYAERVKDFT